MALRTRSGRPPLAQRWASSGVGGRGLHPHGTAVPYFLLHDSRGAVPRGLAWADTVAPWWREMTIERIPGCAIPRVCESRVATTDCATIGPSTSCRIDPRDLRLQTAVQAPAQLFASRVASSTPAAHAAKRVLAQQMRLLQR